MFEIWLKLFMDPSPPRQRSGPIRDDWLDMDVAMPAYGTGI